MPSEDVLKRTAKALERVGATYEGLKELDTRLDRDLQKWVQKNDAARALLRESKDSGRPVAELLEEFRARQEAHQKRRGGKG